MPLQNKIIIRIADDEDNDVCFVSYLLNLFIIPFERRLHYTTWYGLNIIFWNERTNERTSASKEEKSA